MELNKNGETQDEEKANKKLSFRERIKKVRNFITIEPFLICYLYPSIIGSVAIQKLNMQKACLVDLNYTADICDKVIGGLAGMGDDANLTTTALYAAERLVVDTTAWRQPLQSGLPAIVILFVGAWSDRTGNRKALMLIPILGEIVSSIGLILTTYYFLEWPLWITGLIEGLPSALSGGFSIALMGAYSYLADVTTIESRTFRIGIVAVIVKLSYPLGSAISGILTKAIGYYGIFGIGIALYIIGFLQVYFNVHNVRKIKIEGTFVQKLIEFFNPKNAIDTLSLLYKGKKTQFLQVILVVLAHIVIVGPVYGEGENLYPYLLSKFQMTVEAYTFFTAYSVLMGTAGTAVAVTLFSKYLKMHDALIGIIGTISKVISSFVFGLAPTRAWFYSGSVVDFFGNSAITAIRSLGTKVVKPDQVGQMCSLIGFFDALVPVVYTPLYSKVYKYTLDGFAGAYYVLGGVMTIPAFFIFIVLYIKHNKQLRDVVKDPEAKEQHAHDNDIPAL